MAPSGDEVGVMIHVTGQHWNFAADVRGGEGGGVGWGGVGWGVGDG